MINPSCDLSIRYWPTLSILVLAFRRVVLTESSAHSRSEHALSNDEWKAELMEQVTSINYTPTNTYPLVCFPLSTSTDVHGNSSDIQESMDRQN
ncbi:hypothetical protein V8F44DRAFT_599531 [Aspergillus fumigatus]